MRSSPGLNVFKISRRRGFAGPVRGHDGDVTPGLIADYRPGSFLLAAPDRTLLATGVRHVVAEPDPDELATRVTKHLVDSEAPVAVGALPFDDDAAPHVVLPRAVRWGGPARPAAIEPPALPELLETVPVPAPADHERSVAAAVALLRAGELD